MTQSSVSVKAPGKLMIAGEYAVLEQYQRLVVMAVDRYAYATVEDHASNVITLENYGLENISWEITGDGVRIDSTDERLQFVQKAIELTTTYLQESEVELSPISVKVSSELDDTNGVKYGLGSSAAVTTAVVSGILHKFLEEVSDDIVFKLASLAHTIVQGSGSGADIAAASYGGWLEYASFQADWLLEEYEKANSLSRLVKRNWQYSKLERRELPNDLHLVVGWTGEAASTTELVKEVRKLKNENHVAFAEFMVQSATAVQGVLHGMKENNVELFREGIQLNRDVLRKIGEDASVVIETPELAKLCDIAEEHGGVAKPSGAGGGDCGIAFMPTREAAEAVKQAWEKAGIKPLAIEPQVVGVTTN